MPVSAIQSNNFILRGTIVMKACPVYCCNGRNLTASQLEQASFLSPSLLSFSLCPTPHPLSPAVCSCVTRLARSLRKKRSRSSGSLLLLLQVTQWRGDVGTHLHLPGWMDCSACGYVVYFCKIINSEGEGKPLLTYALPAEVHISNTWGQTRYIMQTIF